MNTLECAVDRRRNAVRNDPGWNGLDYVEVDELQTTLTVVFLGKAPQALTAANFTITGGRTANDRVSIVAIETRRGEASYLDDEVFVRVDKPGDDSTYTLGLAGLPQIDPRYTSVDFSFKANCPSDLDCASACGCEPEIFDQPAIDYLAKDYAGFRQLVLDRFSLICPDWRERHAADLGIALIEALAYTGDYLSYYQDAVATEAYLQTARRRSSVRRHARLVDYTLSEGCNARAFLSIEVFNDLHVHAADIRFLTALDELIPIGDRAALAAREIAGLDPAAYEVFQPLTAETEIHLWQSNNVFSFYTWGARECCLAKGATKATLWSRPAPINADAQPDYDSGGDALHLQAGDLLLFEEVLGPLTGLAGDANVAHRQAVRLTRVQQTQDELLDQTVIEIEWSPEDALRFDLCVAAIGAAPGCVYREDISIARGNILLVDHGRPIGPEDLGVVPARPLSQCCECEGEPSEPHSVPGRFAPQLQASPLTFAAPLRPAASAAALFHTVATDALPQITLASADGAWLPLRDLLASSADVQAFVVEMEENGLANLRFGDGELGKQPPADAAFQASYRIGNGTAGNVGAESIRVLVHRDSDLSNDIARVRNPLPAQGGTAREPMAEAKLNAPFAFRFGAQAIERAITPDDYARLAERNPKIQRAAARLVWTGSWYEAEVGVDVEAAYAAVLSGIDREIDHDLQKFRRLGHDLDVRPGEYVPIDLALTVCIAPGYLQGHVKAALLDAFSNRALPGGKLGFFHPDRLTFGSNIYLSAVVAAAQSIPGVVSVEVTRLQRQMLPSNQELQNGLLPLGPYSIPQLDNDPNYPDRGRLAISVKGGR